MDTPEYDILEKILISCINIEERLDSSKDGILIVNTINKSGLSILNILKQEIDELKKSIYNNGEKVDLLKLQHNFTGSIFLSKLKYIEEKVCNIEQKINNIEMNMMILSSGMIEDKIEIIINKKMEELIKKMEEIIHKNA